jgi:phosphoribosylaminoimidazole-succinocarboxamide synthase
MTSVKEFRVSTPATPTELGTGAFVFTDAYSVFDWGRMPDPIPSKGAALCTMSAKTFELLEEAGVPTHYNGLEVDETVLGLSELDAPHDRMAIDLTQVPALTQDGHRYDYEAYHSAAGDNYLIPLEIIFRNQVPRGSSLRTRKRPAEVGLETDRWPSESVELPTPVVEFSSKFEQSDRYLDREEAGRIAGLADIEQLESIARRVNELISAHAARTGLEHADGKIECLYVDGSVRVADTAGTLDENRFLSADVQLSKEALRQYHKREQSAWVAAVAEAKQDGTAEGIVDWREQCALDPEPLPTAVIETVSDLYTAVANSYVGAQLFDTPSLEEAVESVASL